jgi:hypothetical protein
MDPGVAGPAPQGGNRAWEARELLRREADWLFSVGLALTTAGVAPDVGGLVRGLSEDNRWTRTSSPRCWTV